MKLKQIHALISAAAVMLILSCATTGQNSSAGIELSRDVKKMISNACFEVLVEKPVKDSLSYEKELPWDEIPYNIRTDKYYSIGTAFAISDTELLSAGHVLSLTRDSKIYVKAFIRDNEGNVFEIQNITGFDTHKDFVKFTVKDRKFSTWFELNKDYETNERVYSVGNAYGEGIVIRKGELLGLMPEPESGKFKLLKSSSDVNPGNSGGPLLDKDGRVIGVILSKKDNLTYSLPVGDVLKSKANRGFYHTHMNFGFYLIPGELSKAVDFDVEMNLPMEYKALKSEYKSRFYKFYISKMDEYFRANAATIFPEGDVSLIPLYDYTTSFLLQTTYQNRDNKKWVISNLEYKTSEIKDNGEIRVAAPSNKIIFVDITRPDTVPLESMLKNPGVAMDLFLEGISATRNFVQSKIRITSLGKPYSSSAYIDRYGRKWALNTWITEYNDEALLTLATPTPQGVSMILIGCSSSEIDFWTYDLKRMADFVYVSYFGKLREWQEFMNQKSYLPSFINDLKFSFKPDKSFSLKHKHFSVEIDNSIIKLDGDTSLGINYSYLKENDRVIWDVRKVALAEHDKSNYIVLQKHIKPDEKMTEDYLKEWKKLTNADHPFNREPFENNGISNIGGLHSRYAGVKAGSKQQVLYTIFAAREEKLDKEKLVKYLELVDSGIKIIE